ncbi:hypothetical protein GQ55_8G247200 [Panicum hallii var. hallii]|uniref:Uncharacterized protein n=1 Tax=Panicum hallii var. hallii TaxID=1504633 RepID=A0A2T7CQX8_9POAL|nr:hypothetical protein GQ55_8G247200 [Panicum hallii var. hallii]
MALVLDLLSMLKQIVEFGLTVKAALEQAGHNAEDCRWIGELLLRLRAIAAHLQDGAPPEAAEGGGSMVVMRRDAAAGLGDALRRASELIARCQRHNFVIRAFEAGDVAEKLRRVCLDVLLNLSAAVLADGVHTAAMVAEIKEAVGQLRADVAYTNAMFARILQIVAAHPDVHLREEVAVLVKDYQNSTEYASSQNGNKRETKKTDVGRPELKIQKNNGLGRSKVAPHASLSGGLAESASVESVTRQHSSSTIIDKASSSVSKLVDEVPSVAVCAAPFQLQKIISVSEVPGEAGSYKIHSQSSNTSKLLEVYPLKLRVPFEPNKETLQWPMTLTNKTDHYVGVWVKPTHERFTRTPMIMESNSSLVVSVTMKMHEQPPQDTVKFEVVMIIVQSKDNLVKLESSIGGKLNIDSSFMERVQKQQAEVYRAMLTAITFEPGSCQIISKSIKNMTFVTSIDAHPTKTWIVMGHEGGNFSIWDYQTQEIVMELQVNEIPGKFARRIHGISQIFKETAVPHSVCSVKFIAQEKWLAVGDGEGYIYVYAYTDTHKLDKVTRFRAYRQKSVDSLAVHPTEPYLLSSSAFDRKIKLWDWSKDWEKIKEFDVKPISTYEDGVRSVKFNPRDTNTFACVLYDKTVKVGNINSSNLKTTLKGASNADYFFTSNHQNLMVTLSFKSPNSEIRDLDTGKIVHTLGVSGLKMSRVACQPKLPILATTLDDGTICLWDASTYKLEEVVHITDEKCRDLKFVTDINGLTRLIVTFETTIAIMEVNLPIANSSKQIGSGNYG